MSNSDSHNTSGHHDPNPKNSEYNRRVPDLDYDPQFSEVVEEGVDFIDLIELFWDKRVTLAKITGIFVVLGILIALFSKVEYQASATLIPEAQSTGSTASNLLQQYGGLLGLGGGATAGMEGTIPPQLYPNVVESLPYQIELMNTSLQFADYDTTTTAFVFLNEIYAPSVFDYIKQYTLGLPGKVIGLFNNEKESLTNPITKTDRDSIITLSKKQIQTINDLRNRLSVDVSDGTGVITVVGEFPDPRAAAELTQAGIKLLKEYMREYRTQKAQEDLAFVKEQVARAQKEFEEAQSRLAEFRDSNLNLATAKAQTREQELESQYDLSFNLYNSLKQQLQQNQLKVQEQTPVFSVLQPVSVPLEKSAPNRLLIVVVSGLLGSIFALIWVFVSHWWKIEEAKFRS